MSWTFQHRLSVYNDEEVGPWRVSARAYDKPEDAAAGLAHCQSILAMHGVMLEGRLVPHKHRNIDHPIVGADATPEVTHPIGFAPSAKS